jgi:type I restriction enzyme, S subunit
VPGLNREDVYAIDVQFPSLGEQKQIGAVIDVIENSIELEKTILSDLAGLKRLVMQELFTRGLSGETQNAADIGIVPKDWTCEKLGSVADISYGAQAAVANATDPSIGTLILTNVNLDLDGNINLEKKRYYKIPDGHNDRLSLSRGDVLFNWRSGSADHVGKTVYFDFDGDYTYSSFILRFRPLRAVSSKVSLWMVDLPQGERLLQFPKQRFIYKLRL